MSAPLVGKICSSVGWRGDAQRQGVATRVSLSHTRPPSRNTSPPLRPHPPVGKRNVFRLVGSHLCNTFSRQCARSLPRYHAPTAPCTCFWREHGRQGGALFIYFPHHQSDGTQVFFKIALLSHVMHSCMAVVCRYPSTAVPACLMLRLTVTIDHVSALTAHAYRSFCSCGGVCISAKSLWENRE